MSNTSLTVNVGDFDENKEALKVFLKAQSGLVDLDFEGGNIDQLLSVLAFNTYLNMFYKNMSTSETWLDSASQRDSIVSRAKELNYVPRSFKSAAATVNILIKSTDLTRSSIVIPKGTLFVARVGDRSFSFTTDRAIITTESEITDNGTRIAFTASNVELYEGHYLSETVPYVENTPIIIPNQQIDTSSLSVAVIENTGGTVVPYTRATSLLDINEESAVFFVEGAQDSKYQITFGDNIFGRAPKKGSLVVLDYRISNGELPNGAREFRPGQAIDGETQITVDTVLPAHSGAIYESNESIKFNAPRHFTIQERAVTPLDYSGLLRENFPELVDVAAYGGEEATPPRYGHVLISAVLNGVDYLPRSKQEEYKRFLSGRTMMTPLFVEPQYIYAEITSRVKYDVTNIVLNPDDLRLLVLNAITTYSADNLNRFGKTLRFSRLTSAIDNTHSSIISNDTSLKLVAVAKEADWLASRFTFNFNAPLSRVLSERFVYKNASAVIEDDGAGILRVINNNGQMLQDGVGSVDYETGTVQITKFRPDTTAEVKFRVTPTINDITAARNAILKIRDSDIKITMQRGF